MSGTRERFAGTPVAMRRFLDAAARRYPFTVAGTAALAAGVVLFGAGFMRENPYALLLGVFIPAVLAVLGGLGRLQAVRFGRATVRWDSSQTLIARRGDLAERIEVDRVTTFPFYRLHVTLRGRLQVSRDATLRLYREVSTTGGGSAAVPLALPLSGTLETVGRTSIRDVFGLTRNRFGEDYRVVRPVLPESWQRPERIPVAATGGNEEQNRKAQTDEEKYFMREYFPGDKARDINWKASSRLAQLITRISPYTQEKSQLIRVEIRPYRRHAPESLDAVAHLDRMKSGVVGFMRAVKQEHPEYAFDVSCDEARWTVRSEEEIDLFARDLAGVFYRPDTGAAAPPASGELVVFTTPFDTRLPAAVAGRGKCVLHIVTTAEPDARHPDRAAPLALYEGILTAPRIDLPIPGRWALRRERAKNLLGASTASGGAAGSVTEHPIAVALFGAP